jgi:uncharacterized repeat protein (TIGR02059 family)
MAGYHIRAGWFWGSGPFAAPIAPAMAAQPAVNGATLTMTWKENLTADASVALAQFLVIVAGVQRTITTAVATVGGLTLTLATPVTAGQAVEVSYTPGGDPLKDDDGTLIPGFTSSTVKNNTP